MLLNTTVFALFLYPVLYTLPFNWVRFMWGMRRGIAPMPPEVEEHAQYVDREVFPLMHGSLLTIVVCLLRSSAISTAAVGLSSNNWKSALALGVLFSLAPLAVGALIQRRTPPDERLKDREARGPVAVWLGIILLKSFAQEMWRAFCIVSLISLNAPAWLAILITGGAYGSLQLHKSKATALGAAFYGCIAGFLFVKTGSLLAPLAMSLAGGAGLFYQARYLRSRPQTVLARFKCPYCSQMVEGMERPREIYFECPKCRGNLKLDVSALPLVVFGALGAVLTLYLFGVHEFGCIFLFPLLFILYGFTTAIFITLFAPELRRVVADRSFFDLKNTLFPS